MAAAQFKIVPFLLLKIIHSNKKNETAFSAKLAEGKSLNFVCGGKCPAPAELKHKARVTWRGSMGRGRGPRKKQQALALRGEVSALRRALWAGGTNTDRRGHVCCGRWVGPSARKWQMEENLASLREQLLQEVRAASFGG